MTEPTNDALVQGLRDLADFMEQNSDLDWSYCKPDISAIVLGGEKVAAFAAIPGGWDKRVYDHETGGNFELRRKFGPVKFSVIAPRDDVCERRVVGVETVEIPDPAAPKVTVEREIVEWDCKPVLAQAS